MELLDFDYCLPKDLIAQYPKKARDSSRLMVLERWSNKIEHKKFSDLSGYLREGDLLVLNDTKVMPARLFGKRPTGGKVEILLISRKEGLVFEVMISPARIKVGEKIIFADGQFSGELLAKNIFSFSASDINQVYAQGVMPLPPYIKRAAQKEDDIYYQTVFAREDGSIAAPTAGLHFTQSQLSKIRALGVDVAFITLHVGLGTFKPVESEDILQHKIHREYFKIPEETINLVKQTRSQGKRVFAVGTTTLRSLEASSEGSLEGFTDLFIYPGYKFKLVDCLLTNFHLPKTTLFMLVCALAGRDFVKQAYNQAIENKYMFYSYGDAMLVV